MRLAIISDTHLPKGSRSLPDECRRRLADADAILHAGDLMTASVLDELEAIGPPVHAVHGNVDGPALRARLPETLELELGGVRIAMVHDSGPSSGRLERMRTRFPRADVVVFGHSHMPLLELSDAGPILLNPGSPTERRRATTHTMAVGELTGGQARFELVALD